MNGRHAGRYWNLTVPDSIPTPAPLFASAAAAAAASYARRDAYPSLGASWCGACPYNQSYSSGICGIHTLATSYIYIQILSLLYNVDCFSLFLRSRTEQ